MSIVVPDRSQFQYIIRLLNTNIDGKRKIQYAMTAIKGIGARYSNLVLKKADVDLNKRYVHFFMLGSVCIAFVLLVPSVAVRSCSTTSLFTPTLHYHNVEINIVVLVS